MFLKPLPLAEQQELHEANLIDLVRQILPGPGQGCRLTLNQLCRPLKVGVAMVPGFQRPEQGIVFQPVRPVVAELLKGGLQLPGRPRAEVGPGPFEQPAFERDHDVVINGGCRK